jgi:HEAT repeat protein
MVMAIMTTATAQESRPSGDRHEKDVAERLSAIRALKELHAAGRLVSVEPLVSALDDSNRRVRFAAATALLQEQHVSTRVLEILTEALGARDWHMRWRACMALQEMGGSAREAAPSLVFCVVFDADKLVIRQALMALSEVAPDDPRSVAAAIWVLQQREETALREQAVSMLACAGNATHHALPWLLKEINANRHGLAAAAARLVDSIEDLPVTTAVDLLDSPMPVCRRAALRNLVGHRPSVQRIRVMLGDKDPTVRSEAAWCLSTFGTRGSVRALVTVLDDQNPRVRADVVRALGSMGPAARTAIPDLVRALFRRQATAMEKALVLEALPAVGGGSIARIVRQKTQTEIQADLRHATDVKQNCEQIISLIEADSSGDLLRLLRTMCDDRSLELVLRHSPVRSVRQCALMLLDGDTCEPHRAVALALSAALFDESILVRLHGFRTTCRILNRILPSPDRIGSR